MPTEPNRNTPARLSRRVLALTQAGRARRGMRGQRQWRPGLLAEVEVCRQIAKDAGVLADVRSRVGAAVGAGVQAGAVQEVVLDELVERVEGQRLVIDVAVPGIRADNQHRDAQAVSVGVGRRRDDVVIEAAPVVPGEEDRGRAPVRALRDRVDQVRDVGLAGGEIGRRVVAVRLRGGDPGDRGQRAAASATAVHATVRAAASCVLRMRPLLVPLRIRWRRAS